MKGMTTLFSLNFAKNQEPHFPSIKFRDFGRKVELEYIKFRIFVAILQPQNYNNINDMIATVNNSKQNGLNITKQ